MDRWLKSGKLGKGGIHRDQQESSAATVSADSTTTADCSGVNAEEALHDLQVQPGKCETEQDKERVSKKHKYDESYIELGFTWTGDAGYPQQQCVLCCEVLSNSRLKPFLLHWYLETKHNQMKDKLAQFFKRKLEELKTSKKIMQLNSCIGNINALQAAYLVSCRMAKTGKPHTVAEDLIISAAKDMVRCMLDESMDLGSLANLLVYVRYMHESTMHEDFLLCCPVPTRTTGEDIYLLFDNFLCEHRIDWSRCVGICTDGAKSMTGKHSGVMVCIQAVATESTELLNSRIFVTLCDEMGSDHSMLLLHTDIRWLSI
ncbi:ZBED5 protein, partial [Polyodon spathula]|nr:ZBED5 protein [Polyodon spathula]